MPKTDHHLAGRIVAKGACNECRKDVDIKINKGGTAYYSCMWPRTENGRPCAHHERFSRIFSNNLIAKFENHGAAEPAAANDNRPPKKEKHDAAKNFLTRYSNSDED